MVVVVEENTIVVKELGSWGGGREGEGVRVGGGRRGRRGDSIPRESSSGSEMSESGMRSARVANSFWLRTGGIPFSWHARTSSEISFCRLM